MPSTTSNDLNTSTKWDGLNETHDGYKAWVNDVSLWANNCQMAWIMKIAKHLQEVPNFRRPVSRAPPLREQFLYSPGPKKSLGTQETDSDWSIAVY